MFNLARLPTNRLELVVRGNRNGQPRSWLFSPVAQHFVSDQNGEAAQDLPAVIGSAAAGNEFTAILVPFGSGLRLALDRDDDGFFNTTEIENGSDPANAASRPHRIISISRVDEDVILQWQSIPNARYTVQWRPDFPSSFGDAWSTLGNELTATNTITTYTDASPEPGLQRFYRVRMEP
jgi:hypothetical protein